MSFFNRNDDDFEDDGPMFGGSERADERRAKLERAREIASGITSGFLERDEEVWALVRKLKGEE